MEYDNTNSGILFKHDKKGNDKAPDYSGKINVNGEEMRLAAWVREGKAGKFMSLKVTPQEKNNVPKPAPVESFASMANDLPF